MGGISGRRSIRERALGEQSDQAEHGSGEEGMPQLNQSSLGEQSQLVLRVDDEPADRGGGAGGNRNHNNLQIRLGSGEVIGECGQVH